MRVPDFFIVGTPKTGTTSLHEMLRQHPQLFMSELKEPRFLADDMTPRAGFEEGPRESGYPTTMEDYLALFADASPGQRVGEATTMYLWSRSAAQNIARLAPDARIIAIFREPASFLRSLHQAFLKGRNEGERDLRKALSLQQDRLAGRNIPATSHRPQLLQYYEHVRYAEQLRRYSEHFPPERMLVCIYDDFRTDNDGSIRRMLRFLEVDEDARIELARANVTERSVRSYPLKRLLHTLSAGEGPLTGPTKAAVKALTPSGARRGALATVRRRVVAPPPPPPDAQLMRELRRRFKPEVVALGEYIERDLVGLWGYEDID